MSNKKRVAVKTEISFYEQVRDVFVEARQFVHKTANFAMVKAYWLVGKMIVEKQGDEAKAAYGDALALRRPWGHRRPWGQNCLSARNLCSPVANVANVLNVPTKT